MKKQHRHSNSSQVFILNIKLSTIMIAIIKTLRYLLSLGGPYRRWPLLLTVSETRRGGGLGPRRRELAGRAGSAPTAGWPPLVPYDSQTGQKLCVLEYRRS